MSIDHSWEVTAHEAVEIQKKLRDLIQIRPLDQEIKYIAGADISFNRFSEIIYAGFVIFKYPELTKVAYSGVVTKSKFPYISGLLSFREIPPLLEAWNQLKIIPDLIVLDGQGIAHPRRLGIASHFGLITSKPTIGCGKSLLVGKYTEPDLLKGSKSYIYDKNELIGSALRTKTNTNPVFISIGNLITLSESENIILSSGSGYRIPEPTRQAHLFVNALRTGEAKPGYYEAWEAGLL